MNELLDLAQKFAPLVGSLLVPIVGGVLLPLLGFRREPRDPAAVRSMRRHAQLHESLPEGAKEPIKKLIEFEAATYARTLMRRGTRTVDGPRMTALVLVAAILVVVEYVLISAAFVWWPAVVAAGAFGGFGIALIGYGARSVFAYNDVEPAGPEDGGQSSVSPS